MLFFAINVLTLFPKNDTMYYVILYFVEEETLMEYIKVSKAAEKWGISPRRVRTLCAEGKVEGVIRKGKLYMIPETAVKPMDGRLSKTNIIAEIEYKTFIAGQSEYLFLILFFTICTIPLYITTDSLYYKANKFSTVILQKKVKKIKTY